ncbi:MAG: dihydroorotate dehydrogenase, partial [Actinobacteria bacterium]|nr:dihydroorotate dehydrogenase [Actinomycetota bacterium]
GKFMKENSKANRINDNKINKVNEVNNERSEGNHPNLEVHLGRIRLKNPVVMCSGTFSSGVEYSRFYDVNILGAITTKSFTLKKRLGNPPPRICETPCGMLNSIGLQNDGIDCFAENHLPALVELGVDTKSNIILSVAGQDENEFKEIALKVKEFEDKLLAVELNLSCPNIKEGGKTLDLAPENVEKVTSIVGRILEIPMIVKLSPEGYNLVESARRAKNGGAEAISVMNSIVGMAVDVETFKPKIGNILGGLSGPAIRPISLAKVYTVAREKILPVIGMGGVYTWEDALEFLIVGARAVGIGSANFVNYRVGIEVIQGIASYLERHNIKDINSIIGKISTTPV